MSPIGAEAPPPTYQCENFAGFFSALLLLAYAGLAGPLNFYLARRAGQPLRALGRLPVISVLTLALVAGGADTAGAGIGGVETAGAGATGAVTTGAVTTGAGAASAAGAVTAGAVVAGADTATADGATGAGADDGAEASAGAVAGAVGAFTILSIQIVLSRKVVPDLRLLTRTPLGSFSFRIWP